MRVRAIASAIPQTVYSAEEIAAWLGTDARFIRDKVGVDRRAFLAPAETGVSLATQAVDRLLSEADVDRGSIELLAYVTQNPDYRIPHNSALLQAAAELPRSIAAFDIGLGCSGYPYALTISKGFMSAQGLRRAIVVTCDPYSRVMRRDDKATVAVFGDAATATLLDCDGTGEIGLGDFGTDGSGKSCLVIPAGSAARPIWSIQDAGPSLSEPPDDYRLHMNGRAVFDFVMREVPGSISRTLMRNNLGLDEIDYFAIHQGSLYMLNNLANEVGIPSQKLLVNIEKVGNTVSSTIPLLLEEQMRSKEQLKGRALISGFGVGLSWGSLPLTFS